MSGNETLPAGGLQAQTNVPHTTATPQILLLDSHTGKPIAHHRLLIFAGSTPEKVRFHERSFDLWTDAQGRARLPVDQADLLYLQVFADFLHQCQPEPNLHSYSLADIHTTGISAPNGCSQLHIEPRPNTLTLYAREPKLREKIAW